MFLSDDTANPEDSKSVVYLSHEVQKVRLLIGWQVAQGAETCIKVSLLFPFTFKYLLSQKW